jgi:peptide/nickel transport system substrate-binding protein
MAQHDLSRRSLLQSALGAGAIAAWPGAVRAQGAPRRGGTLVVAADSQPRNLNPAMVASNGVFYVASKVIEPLAEMAYDGSGLAPRLATDWTGSADGRSITFKLRPGVSWHDGKPFTSADVAFSALQVWKKAQNLGRVLFNDLETVDTPDGGTAIFRFSQPTPFQLIRNALPAVTAVVPKHLYEGTDLNTNPANTRLVGTGPFRFIEHKPGEYYRLARNTAYWDADKPYLDGIVYRVLPDAGAIAAAIEANQIQLAAFSAISLAELPRLAAIKGVQVVNKGYEGITYQLTVEINHRRKELADARVRRAIAHAIDKEFVVKTIFGGYATASSGPIPKFDRVFHVSEAAVPAFDVARANALLDEAGYPRQGGVRFRLRLLPAPWFEQTRQMGDYLRQALRAVGIEAELVSNDPAGHTKAVYTDHAFDLAIGSPVYRNDPAISTTLLYQGGIAPGVPFSNQYGYNDAALNALMNKASETLDPAARAQLYRDFQRVVAQSQPLIHVAEFTFTSVIRDTVRNVANNPRWATSNWADTWLSA